MPKWAKNAKEFTVLVVFSEQRGVYCMHVPKPILKKMGTPDRLTYLIYKNGAILCRPDALDLNIAQSTR